MFKKFHFRFNIAFLQAVPKWMAEHPFLGFLTLLLFAFFLSGWVFYQYVYLVDDQRYPMQVIQTTFQERSFQELIKTWEERETVFEGASNIQRRNIFLPVVPDSSSEELTEDES